MKKRFVMFSLLALMMIAVISLDSCKKSQTGSSRRVTIKVEVFDRGTDGGKTNVINNKWTEWIQKKLLADENIFLTFEPVPRAEETQSLINLMAAGTPPDVCMTYDINNVNNWAAQGGVFDISPYIDTTLKDLKDFLGPDDALPGRDFIRRNQNAQTGQIFSFPSKRVNVARLNTFIRKDWLDKLGLPVPKTPEEYFNTLAAFKERDPGNVGRNNVIPFTMAKDVRWRAGSILEAFIDPNITLKDRWVNTIADRHFLLPGYKEGARFINRMWNAGLIDKDFALYRDDLPGSNLIKSGVVGSFSHNWDQIFRDSDRLITDMQKNVPDAMWTAVDCMTSSDGVTHKISYDAAGLNVFIPKASKNPDAAMRYLNWLAKFENYNFLQIGPEGIVHNKVDGVPKLIPNAVDGWMQNSSMNIDYTPIMNGLFLETEELSIRAIAGGYPFPEEMVMNAYKIAMNNAKPGPVIITSTPLEAAGPVSQTLIDKSEAFVIQAITAPAAGFDRLWDAGIADWLDSGARVVRNEREAKFVAP